ncbi:MAG: hypothetical protein AAF790_11925 [Planctomycetota bacterium]
MRSRRRAWALVTAGLAAAFAPVAAGAAGAAEPLRWKFEPGQRLPYRIEKRMQMEIDGAEAGVEATDLTQTIDMAWVVEAVDPAGAARMVHDVTRVQVAMRGRPGQGYTFDTRSPDPPEDLARLIAPLFRTLVETDYRVTITPRGEMRDVAAPADLLDAMQRTPGGEGLDRFAAETLVGPAVTPLPEGPVEPGDEWRQTSMATVPAYGRQKTTTTFRYDGPASGTPGGLVRLTPTVEIATAMGGADLPVTGTLKSLGAKGEVLFDRAAGRLHASKIEQKLASQLTVGSSKVQGTLTLTTTVTYGEPAEPATRRSCDR